MGKQACKQADVWLAASRTGELAEADRIRLQEHLQGCAACSQRARELDLMVQLLRDEPLRLSEPRMRQLWQQVQLRQAEPETRAGWLARPSRPWVLGLAAAAAVLLIAAGALWLTGRGPAVEPPIPAVARQTPKNVAPRPTRQPWQVISVSGARALGGVALEPGQLIRPGSRLEVDREGTVLLASAHEVILARGNSSLSLSAPHPGDAELRLTRGEVMVATLQGHRSSAELVVTTDGLRVQPVGTAFWVSHLAGQPQVEVAEGRVNIARDHGPTLSLRRGEIFRRGKHAGRLPARRRDQLAEQAEHCRLLARRAGTAGSVQLQLAAPPGRRIVVDGMDLGATRVAMLTMAGQHRAALQLQGAEADRSRVIQVQPGQHLDVDLSPIVEEQPAPRAVRRSFRKRSRRRGVRRSFAARTRALRRRPTRLPPKLATQVEEVRGLLSQGEARKALQQTRRLMKQPGAEVHRALLTTLMAESMLRQGRYEEARITYRRVWNDHGRTLYGAEALYMLGSLELEQLGCPSCAQHHFETYLSTHPHGRQRQGAHYLLCRSLHTQGKRQQARRARDRYLAEFPSGQFREALDKLLFGSASPKPPKEP